MKNGSTRIYGQLAIQANKLIYVNCSHFVKLQIAINLLNFIELFRFATLFRCSTCVSNTFVYRLPHSENHRENCATEWIGRLHLKAYLTQFEQIQFVEWWNHNFDSLQRISIQTIKFQVSKICWWKVRQKNFATVSICLDNAISFAFFWLVSILCEARFHNSIRFLFLITSSVNWLALIRFISPATAQHSLTGLWKCKSIILSEWNEYKNIKIKNILKINIIFISFFFV